MAMCQEEPSGNIIRANDIRHNSSQHQGIAKKAKAQSNHKTPLRENQNGSTIKCISTKTNVHYY